MFVGTEEEGKKHSIPRVKELEHIERLGTLKNFPTHSKEKDE